MGREVWQGWWTGQSVWAAVNSENSERDVSNDRCPKKDEGIYAYLNRRECVEPRLRCATTFPFCGEHCSFPHCFAAGGLNKPLNFPQSLWLQVCSYSVSNQGWDEHSSSCKPGLRVVASCVCYLMAFLGYQGTPTADCDE